MWASRRRETASGRVRRSQVQDRATRNLRDAIVHPGWVPPGVGVGALDSYDCMTDSADSAEELLVDLRALLACCAKLGRSAACCQGPNDILFVRVAR